MPDGTLYDDDILAWSEQQAALLRRLAEIARGLPNELDLENVAEEIESVGRSELSSAESLIELILLHLMKAASDPEAPSLAHWKAEVVAFHLGLRRAYSRSMAQRVDMDDLWQGAKRLARARLIAEGARLREGLPETSPIALEDLTGPEIDFDALLRKVVWPVETAS